MGRDRGLGTENRRILSGPLLRRFQTVSLHVGSDLWGKSETWEGPGVVVPSREN